MNNDIKEILDNIKDTVDGYGKKCNYNQDEVIYDEINYSSKQWYLLLDYITNLQEEVKSSNESIIWWQNRFNALQKENERLKKLCDEYEEEHSNEFQCWKRDRKELLDKRTRNEKAIEYITHAQNYGTMAQVMPHLKPYVNGDDLLNILGGDDND